MRRIICGTGLLLAVSALAGCSLRFDFTECEVPEDCRQFESPGVHYTCVSNRCAADPGVQCRATSDCGGDEVCADNICEPSATNNNNDVPDMGDDGDASDAGDDDASETGETDGDGDGVVDGEDNCPQDANSDQADIDLDGVGDVCDPDVRTPCTSNTECEGATDICVAGFCAELTSPECETVLGNTTAPDTFTFGVILPTSAPYEAIGPPLAKSIELAVVEVNRSGGLPGGRRVAAVVCDDAGSSDRAQAAATHLVSQVQVPAIIGPIFSTPFVDVVTNVTKPAGVLTITPTATDPNLTFLDDDDLAFRLLPSDIHQAKAIAARIEQLGTTSVTIFIKDDAYGNGLFNALNNELTFLASDPPTAVKYTDPATLGFDPALIKAEFESKVMFALGSRPAPTLALFIGTSEAVSLALMYSGAILSAGGTTPQLLMAHGAVPDMPSIPQNTTPLGNGMTLGEVLEPLTSGVGPNIFNGAAFNQYNARFAAEFPGEPNLTISTLTYDATATVLFAAAAVPSGEEVTGRKLADAILPKLVDKTNGTDVTAANGSFLSEGIAIISGGGSIDYEGASHQVDYDENGDILTDFLVFNNFQNPANQTWEIVPNKLFPLSLNTWLELCTYPWNPPCSTGLACSTLPPLAGVCLPACDLAAPMCTSAPFLECQDHGVSGGVCNVP